MRARELIPWLVAAQALTILLLIVILAVMLSWRRMMERTNRRNDTIPIRRVS